jgi:hypothetical protein
VDMTYSRESSFDSLFDEPTKTAEAGAASLEAPPIPGLWVFPSLLPVEAAGTYDSQLGYREES